MQHALISASKVEGTPVTNRAGENLGRIEDVMIDKLSGHVVYAVLSFGGVLGLGSKHFALPWEALHYVPEQAGYVLEIAREILDRAPGFDADKAPDMSDRRWGQQIHDYYGYRPYWERQERGEAGGAQARLL